MYNGRLFPDRYQYINQYRYRNWRLMQCIWGRALHQNNIPSFCWGSEGVKEYDFDKALLYRQVEETERQKTISEEEKMILKYIFEN